MSKELIVPQNTFVVSTTQTAVDPELRKAMTDEDADGFETTSGLIPIVSIRQKALKNDKGKEIFPAGGFKMYDSVSKEAGQQIADVDGEIGLTLTMLMDKTSRVYFESLTDQHPKCRSNDGNIGDGNPGGACAKCPLSQFGPSGDSPVCKQQINILAFDHAGKAPYQLRLGRSALKPYNSFKELMRRSGLPIHAVVVKVTTVFMSDKGEYYVPKFEVVDTLGGEFIDIFREMQKARAALKDSFGRTVEVVEVETDKPEPQDTDYEEQP